MVQRFSLRTAPPLNYGGNRVNAPYGNSLLSLMSQKQNVLNQWSNAGVERVAKQARQAERKVKVDNQILVKVPYREQPTNLPTRYSKNDAIDVVIEDMANKHLKVGPPLTGHIVTGIPNDQVDALRTLIKYADTDKDGNVTDKELSKYYKLTQGHGYTGGDRSTEERLKDGFGQIEHTLGQFKYYINPLSRDTVVTDTYDFNKKDYSINKAFNDFKEQYKKSHSLKKSIYPWERYVAGKLARHDDESDDWKRHYRINITRQSGYSK